MENKSAKNNENNEDKENSAAHLQINLQQSLREATDSLQTTMLKQAYQENNQNWAAAARQLQVDTGNLHRLAKRLKLK